MARFLNDAGMIIQVDFRSTSSFSQTVSSVRTLCTIASSCQFTFGLVVFCAWCHPPFRMYLIAVCRITSAFICSFISSSVMDFGAACCITKLMYSSAVSW